ncbi:MAG: 4-alpha-glucanotransferase [Eubacteriales bacterium]
MNNTKNNFGFSHKSGILMPVSSLPSEYGIGDFGKCAFEFVDFLDETAQKCWQVLPLNPTSYGDSPYQSPAACAGNPYFISLELLYEQGLLTEGELEGAKREQGRINYGRLFNERYAMLRKAFARFSPDEEYEAFCAKNALWLDDYALFMALKVHYNFSQWTLWAEEHRDASKARTHADEFESEMNFWKWIQFEFMREWKAVVDYAHTKNITIIGDMPIYVAHDSVDVWSEPEQFLLDEHYNPTIVAGCPPDGFSPDGQLWGNPIYNYKLMAEQDFAWWVKRARANFELYDIIRIDHFRGFSSYYAIPAGDSTARNGKWIEGPGIALFEAIDKALPDSKIIAEDLGFITEDVVELLEQTGYPGMKMLHFAFYDEESEYLPRNYPDSNCIVYSASHDSDCSYTWYYNLEGEALERFREECPRRVEQTPVEALIEFAMTSIADLAMVPIMDYLELTNKEGRINTPAVAEGNWSFRVSPDYATDKLKAKILDVTTRTSRAK